MHSSEPKTPRFSKLTGCLALLAIPVVMVAILAAAIIINNRPVTVLIPTKTLPDPNGYDDFVRATKLIGAIKSPVSSTKPPEEWTQAELEAFVKDNAQAMAAVREGLKKDCVTPSVRTLDDGPYVEWVRFRELARIMAGESMYYRRNGDHADAADSSLNAMEFGVAIPHGGFSMVMLSGASAVLIGAASLSKVLPDLSQTELERVAARLRKMQGDWADFSEVVVEDGNCFAAEFSANLRNQRRKPKSSLQDWVDSVTVRTDPFPNPMSDWQQVQFAITNKARLLTDVQAYYHRVAEAQREPYNNKLGTALYNGPLVALVDDEDTVLSARASYCRAQAITTMLQAEVALRRYCFDHGSYPASLKQLSPNYLKKTPVDPFGQGKALCYKPLESGQDFLLYSRGPNLKDDGGKDEPWNKIMGKDYVAANQPDGL